MLTHSGRVTHICVNESISTVSVDGLSPVRHQTIIWINAEWLSTEPSRTKSCEFSTQMKYFWRRKHIWKCHLPIVGHHDWVFSLTVLTNWGRVTHICVGKLTIIGLDNGLSPGRCQAIIRTNAGILLIGPLVTSFSEILIVIQTFSFKKMRLKMPSGKWRPFCLGLNVLMVQSRGELETRHWID